MFNLQEWLKSLQPGAPGSMMPTELMGAMPMPQTPATPATPVTPAPQATPVAPGAPAAPMNLQFAGPADLSLPSAPNLQGEFPPAPGMGGMLAGIGKAIGTNDGMAGPTSFGGLLKFKDDEAKQAAMRGLLGFSAGMLAGGGPSETPTSLGSIAGKALASGVGSYEGYKDSQNKMRIQNRQIAVQEQDAAAEAAKAEHQRRILQNRIDLMGPGAFNGGSQTGATAVTTPASVPQMPAAGPLATAQPVPPTDKSTEYGNQRAMLEYQYRRYAAVGDEDMAKNTWDRIKMMDDEAARAGLMWNGGTTYVPIPGVLDGYKATEAAKVAGRESQTRTDDIREYDLYVSQETAAGRQPVSFEAWRVSVPTGYQRKQNPDGSIAIEPIPGGPEAAKAAQAAAAADKKADSKNVASNAVDAAFENVIRIRNNATLPTNGLIGGMLSNIGGTGANDMRASLETLKAQASIETIQKMREQSPTGAGMGSPSDAEQKMLQASFATLEQSQSNEEFIRNLNTFRNLWLDMVHGTGNGPERFALNYGLKPLTTEEQETAETRTAPSEKKVVIPQVGEVRGKYRFKGGDPADRANWIREN